MPYKKIGLFVIIFIESVDNQAVPAYSYDTLFPALPESSPSVVSTGTVSRSMIRVESSVVTQVKENVLKDEKILNCNSFVGFVFVAGIPCTI